MAFEKDISPKRKVVSSGKRPATLANHNRPRKATKPTFKFYWGFFAVVCCTLSLATCLTCIAWGRSSGIAWGVMVDQNEVLVDGFIIVDASDVHEDQRSTFLSTATPALTVLSQDGPAPVDTANKVDKNEENKITVEVIEIADIATEKTDTAVEEDEPDEPVNITIDYEGTEDFGPLPKYLSGFEDITLSVHDSGAEPSEAELELNAENEAKADKTSKAASSNSSGKTAADTNASGARSDDKSKTDSKTQEQNDGLTLTEVLPDWSEHVVKSGETLSDIALAHGGLTAQDILRANGLKDANRLSENQLLLIPRTPEKVDKTLAEVRVRQARIAAIREQVEPLKVSAYVVVHGDSLWSISNSQNIELDTLVGSNTLKGSSLRPGTVLRIPNQDGIFYRLQKGEKLADVCKRYGVDLNRLKKVNVNVDVSKLKAGDEIFLPEARPEAITETKTADAKETKTATSTAKGQTTSKTSSSGGAKKTSSSKVTSSRSFKWPLMGRINSPFGWRRHPITKRNSFHTGIDIQGSKGTAIRAAHGGTVVYSGWMGGYGKVLVIEHKNGLSTLYAHCSALLVGKGETITQGQTIARVGMTGRATGAHLHFEVRNGNSPVNPLQYLK